MERIQYVLAASSGAERLWYRGCRSGGGGRIAYMLPEAIDGSFNTAATADPSRPLPRVVRLDVPTVSWPVPKMILFCGLVVTMRDALDQQGWPDGVAEWVAADFLWGLGPRKLPTPDELAAVRWPAAHEGRELIARSARCYTTRGRRRIRSPEEEQAARSNRLGFEEPGMWRRAPDQADSLSMGVPREDLGAAIGRQASQEVARQVAAPLEEQAGRDTLLGLEDFERMIAERLAVPRSLLRGRRRAEEQRSVERIAQTARSEFESAVRILRQQRLELERSEPPLPLDDQRIGEEFFPGQAPREAMDPNDRIAQALVAPSMGHDLEAVETKDESGAAGMSFDEWRAQSSALLKEVGHRPPTKEERDDE